MHNAFPSDHTAWSFAVFEMLLFVLIPAISAIRRDHPTGSPRPTSSLLIIPTLLLMLAFVIACTIGVARIYVGLHYPELSLFFL